MCRADIPPSAEAAVAQVLLELAAALATQEGFPLEAATIGPVDLGPPRGDY